MTPIEAPHLLDAHPLTLSNGDPLGARLVATFGLKPAEAEMLVAEYRRFLALALCAGADEATVPSPLVEAVWETHQTDASYGAFLAALGSAELTLNLTRHRSPHHRAQDPAYKATGNRYKLAFGDITPKWWPTPYWLSLRNRQAGISVVILSFVYLYMLSQSSEAKLLLLIANLLYALCLLQKQNRFNQMAAPRTSFAALSKAPHDPA